MNVLPKALTCAAVLTARIDRERCQGHARCVAIAPELFEVDALGETQVLTGGAVPPDLIDKVYLAASNCPEIAIEIVEGEQP